MWNLSIYGERKAPLQAVVDTGGSESRIIGWSLP